MYIPHALLVNIGKMVFWNSNAHLIQTTTSILKIYFIWNHILNGWNGDVVYWLEAVGSQRLYINTNSDLKEFHKRVERIKLEIYVLFHRYWYVILILVYELYALVISILLILDSGMILSTYPRLWIFINESKYSILFPTRNYHTIRKQE
jgi:hypothetical protein